MSLSLALVVLFALVASQVVHECHDKIKYNAPNKNPILDGMKTARFVKAVKNGRLYEVDNTAQGATAFPIIHVYGSAYEMGYAQGELVGAQARGMIESAWAYLKTQVEGALPGWMPKWLDALVAQLGLDAALDATALVTRLYTNEWVFDELRGLADASGVDYDMALRLHMLAGLTQGKCSLFVANASATRDAHLVQLRALDWNMDGPFRDYPALTVYHPTIKGAHAHALVGMVGFIGGLTGVSEAALGISEIGVSYPDASFGAESRVGLPFIWLLRDILMFDRSVEASVQRLKTTHRTCDLILAVGDGNANYGYGFEYSYATLDAMTPRAMRPKNDTWHFTVPDVVYWGMDWLCPAYSEVLGTELRKAHGRIDLASGVALTGVLGSGDNHAALYDLTAREFVVSYAAPSSAPSSQPQKACWRTFTRFNMTQLFAEKQQTQ